MVKVIGHSISHDRISVGATSVLFAPLSYAARAIRKNIEQGREVFSYVHVFEKDGCKYAAGCDGVTLHLVKFSNEEANSIDDGTWQVDKSTKDALLLGRAVCSARVPD